MAATKTKKTRLKFVQNKSPTVAQQILAALKELPRGKATMASITAHLPKACKDSISPNLARLIRSGHLERDETATPPTYRATGKKYEPAGKGQSSTQRLGYVDVLEGVEPAKLRTFLRGLTDQESEVFRRRIRVNGSPATIKTLSEDLGVSHTTVSAIVKRLLEQIGKLK